MAGGLISKVAGVYEGIQRDADLKIRNNKLRELQVFVVFLEALLRKGCAYLLK